MVDAISDYADSGSLTPATLLAKRKLAQDMLEAGMQTTPISSHWQGLARLAQAGLGGFNMGSLDAQERQQGKRDSALMASLFGGGAAPAASPAPALSLPGSSSASPAGGASAASGAGDMARWSAGISNNESGGDYSKLGPVTKTGDRAYGKYQVMGGNIPAWTKEALGQEMTPEQFLANKDAQDKVFQTKFGQYAQKYGPSGASKAWFAGEGGMNNPGARDQLGTTVAGYADKFNAGAGVSPPAASAPPAAPAAAQQAGIMPQAGTPEQKRMLGLAVQLSQSGDPRKAAVGNMLFQRLVSMEMTSPTEVQDIKQGDQTTSVLRNKQTGALSPIDTSQFAFGPNSKVANTLRDERNNQINIKNLNTTIGAWKGMLTAAQHDNTAGDIALVYGTAKIMDPTSSVREGEYATIANSQSIPEWVKGYASYLSSSGGRLTPESRQQLLQVGRDKINGYRDAAIPENERYNKLAKAFKVDPALVGNDLPEVDEIPQPPKTPNALPKPSNMSDNQILASANESMKLAKTEEQRTAIRERMHGWGLQF